MIRTGLPRGLGWMLAIAMLLGWSSGAIAGRPITRDPELEALQQAVRWPNAEQETIVTLVGRFLADQRDPDAYLYFQERAKSRPDRPLFLALESLGR